MIFLIISTLLTDCFGNANGMYKNKQPYLPHNEEVCDYQKKHSLPLPIASEKLLHQSTCKEISIASVGIALCLGYSIFMSFRSLK
jgi:hypothetical protein